jgi:hypothetical protein
VHEEQCGGFRKAMTSVDYLTTSGVLEQPGECLVHRQQRGGWKGRWAKSGLLLGGLQQ